MSKVYISNASASAFELWIRSSAGALRSITVPAYALNYEASFNSDTELATFKKSISQYLDTKTLRISVTPEKARAIKELDKTEEELKEGDDKKRSEFNKQVDTTINSSSKGASVKGKIKTQITPPAE